MSLSQLAKLSVGLNAAMHMREDWYRCAHLPPRSPKRQLSAGRPSQPRCLASPSGLRRSGPSGHGQSPTAGLSQAPSLPAGAESGRHPPGLGWISGFGGLGKQQCGREKGRKVSGRQTCVSVRAFREREREREWGVAGPVGCAAVYGPVAPLGWLVDRWARNK